MRRRNQQLESSIRRVIGSLLAGGLDDPRLRGLVSVTAISVSPDRRNATVSVSVLPEARQHVVLAGLRHAAGHIRTEMGSQLRIRSVPRLFFELDESLKEQARTLETLREVQEQEDGAETEAVAPPPETES